MKVRSRRTLQTLTLIVAAACLHSSCKKSKGEEARVREPATGLAAVIDEEEVADELVYPAHVLPSSEINVVAEIDGFISTMNLRVGQTVSKDKRLFLITNPDPLVNYRGFIVKAPTTGVISRLEVHAADHVQAGTKLLTLADLKTVKIQVHLTQDDLAKVRLGQEAQWTLGEEKVKLRVSAINRVVDIATGTVLCELLPTADSAFKNLAAAGMLGKVSFIVDRKKILSAADDAIFYRDQKPHVLLLNERNQVSYKAVEISRRLDGQVEIRSGVKSGTRIVISLSEPVNEGEIIKVQNEGQGH